ncbi:MAG: alpha/beta hydrolase, partial [Ktedonobacteraceae bacterium]
KYPQPDYAFLRQRDASRNYEASDRLHEIHVPTLILHGNKDKLAPYRLAEERTRPDEDIYNLCSMKS